MKKKAPKRLLLDIDPIVHAEIKAQAAKRNTTIRKWVTAAIVEALKLEYR